MTDNIYVMHFKQWLLNEITEKQEDNLTSWLSPYGKFVPVKITHSDDAPYIIQMLYPELTTKGKKPADARDLLFEKGWMRISNFYETLFANNPVRVPNTMQKKELIDFAIETQVITEIEYDNDAGTRTIWRKTDI